MKKLPSGCTKVPWGFVLTGTGLVATSSAKERNERAELGEFAISLLGKLGIDEARLTVLCSDPDPIASLKRDTQ